MGRIADCFQRLREQGELGLIAYLTVGYPSVEGVLRLVPALLSAGAHIVELGIPFSDPLADGATIQRASQAALRQGVTPAVCLETVGEMRRQGVEAPLVLMTYCNPVLAYGQERFLEDAAVAGADGLILIDLPPEEAGEVRQRCRRLGLDLITLVAPTTSEERLARLLAEASGFVYCLSVTGVTGAREELPAELPEFLRRVRRLTSLPIAVGFGISKAKHLMAVRPLADAVVIGSAIIERIEGENFEDRVKEYVEVVTGRRGPGQAS